MGNESPEMVFISGDSFVGFCGCFKALSLSILDPQLAIWGEVGHLLAASWGVKKRTGMDSEAVFAPLQETASEPTLVRCWFQAL